MFHFTRYRSLCPMYSDSGIQKLLWMGYPIRKPTDRSVLAAPRGLSQLIASFIAFRHQGIHHVLFVAFDIVHSEIFCKKAFLPKKRHFLTDSVLEVIIFCPICRCQRTSNGTLPMESAGSWDPAQLKNVMDGSVHGSASFAEENCCCSSG